MARRALVALLALVPAIAGGCHRTPAASLVATDHTRLYAAVLQDVLRDSTKRAVVVDSLVPSQDIAADQLEMVSDQLKISRALLDAFVTSQTTPAHRFSTAMLPGARFVPVPMARIDSIRVAARAEAASAATRGEARSDVFWRQWYATYPGSMGFVILSPAMITPDGREALIQVSISCGALCGSGEVRRLRRDADGTWHTTARVELWVS